MSEVESIYAFFHDPMNMPLLLVASDKTQHAWQQISQYQYTQQVPRDGPIHELPEKIDPSIGRITIEFSDKTVKSVGDYFDTSSMDGLVVLRKGDLVYERYKTMRPFDKHVWFSCSKIIVGTSLALLEHEGKVDASKPVPEYFSELKGSVWDSVTVEETLDMATGLDSTEHEEPDARTNPARGWYKWAESIGLFASVNGFAETPVEVLRAMKRTKPGHTVFEYNSINSYVCQMIVERLTRMPIAEFYGNRIWRRIGTEHDGYLGLNKQGHANCFGFMNSTLRDLARFGMAFTPSQKKFGKGTILPDDVIRKFQTGLRPEMYSRGAMGAPIQEAFWRLPGLANRYQWDIVTPDGDFFKAGLGGQGLYISAATDAVVAFFSTGTMVDESKGAWTAHHIIRSFR